MKKNVVLALALLTLMAVGVYAQTEADFVVMVSKDGKSVSIDEYKGSATTVNIPAKIKNLPVTIIGDFGGLKIKSTITSVTIPNGVIEIGDGAFKGCTSLTSVTIPNTVKTIGKNAFNGCFKLASINIPASVTSIGNSAFQDCTGLNSITFGGSIPSSGIHADAFFNLGDIRDKYFAAGGGAGTYTRPDSLIDSKWTKSPVSVAGTPGLAFELTQNGKGYSVSRGTILEGDVVIPASFNNLPVTTVAQSAFNVALINNVTIPASVTEIKTSAFTNCANIKSVTFGSANTNFTSTDFPNGGDLANKYKAGGAGTYTRNGTTWTKK